MKRTLVALIFVSLLAVTGCQGEEEVKAASEKQIAEESENSEEKAAAFEEAYGEYIIEPNDALKSVFSKSWDVKGTEDVYVLESDGTGTRNGEALTYECGFDEENNIVLKFIMEGESEGSIYIVTADNTGYGLDLVPAVEGETMKLFPTNMTLLDSSDERVAGVAGTWKDENENEYIFDEAGTMTIKGSDGDADGTWSAIEKEEEGVVIIYLLLEGGSLEFEYEIQDEGKTMALYNRSAETWYYWYK